MRRSVDACFAKAKALREVSVRAGDNLRVSVCIQQVEGAHDGGLAVALVAAADPYELVGGG